MYRSALQNLATKQLLWRNNLAHKNEIIDVIEDFSKIKHCLVLLPSNLDDFNAALEKTQALQRQFPNARFVCLGHKENFQKAPKLKNVSFLKISDEDITLVGIPRRSVVKKVQSKAYELLIDFNNEFDFLSTYLCSKSRAKLRVCLAHPYRDPFYNFQIRSAKSDSFERKCTTLLKYLTDLVALSRAPQAGFQTVG